MRSSTSYLIAALIGSLVTSTFNLRLDRLPFTTAHAQTTESYFLVTKVLGQREENVTWIDTTGMDSAQEQVQRTIALGFARQTAIDTGRRVFVYGPTDTGQPPTADDRVWDSTVDH